MSLSLEEFNKIMEDNTFLFTEEELNKYPSEEQIKNYVSYHPYYKGNYLHIWTLYFEIIEHLAGKKFSGSSDEENVMKLSMDSSNWKLNESHDVKYISLLFTILSNTITKLLDVGEPFDREWEMLLHYTSMYLPNQINNMLSNKEKSKLFGRYNIKNMPKQNRDMMELMIKTKQM